MSALDNEIGTTVEVDLNDDSLANVITKRKQPKRILHFSDGTIEEYDSNDSDDNNVRPEQPFHTAKVVGFQAIVPVDPKLLTWPQWFKHYAMTGGSKALNAMDCVGENVAYYLGITTPKYQYEIDEYYRAIEEETATKKLEEIEFHSWRTSPSDTPATKETGQPIIDEQKPMHLPVNHNQATI